MFNITLILIILLCIVLIVSILLQPGKGDLSASFGGLGSQFGARFGMQRTADFLSKFTKVIAAVILVLAYIANKLFL